jgi:hypothetical protein
MELVDLGVFGPLPEKTFPRRLQWGGAYGGKGGVVIGHDLSHLQRAWPAEFRNRWEIANTPQFIDFTKLVNRAEASGKRTVRLDAVYFTPSSKRYIDMADFAADNRTD